MRHVSYRETEGEQDKVMQPIEYDVFSTIKKNAIFGGQSVCGNIYVYTSVKIFNLNNSCNKISFFI